MKIIIKKLFIINNKSKIKKCVCVPVIVEIVSEDGQQSVSKLCQSNIIVLDLCQIVIQRLGGEIHLNKGQ